jgi:hypothetical protein
MRDERDVRPKQMEDMVTLGSSPSPCFPPSPGAGGGDEMDAGWMLDGGSWKLGGQHDQMGVVGATGRPGSHISSSARLLGPRLLRTFDDLLLPNTRLT